MTTDQTLNPWPGGPSRSGAFEIAGTIRDRVAFTLRQQILSGELREGERLELDELSSKFGTSRTPIREACLELSHEGLVEVTPRAGSTVIGVSPKDISDNFELMSILGGLAAQWAAERMTDEQLAAILELGSELQATAADDPKLIYRNWLFHREINRACDSNRLLHLLRISGRFVPDPLTMAPEQVSCGRLEHDQLIDALRDRDGNTARAVTEAHFLNAGQLWSEKYAALIRKDVDQHE